MWNTHSLHQVSTLYSTDRYRKKYAYRVFTNCLLSNTNGASQPRLYIWRYNKEYVCTRTYWIENQQEVCKCNQHNLENADTEMQVYTGKIYALTHKYAGKIYALSHTYTDNHTHTEIHKHVYIYIHKCTYIHTHTLRNTYTSSRIHPQKSIYTYAYEHIHISICTT